MSGGQGVVADEGEGGGGLKTPGRFRLLGLRLSGLG